MSLIINHTCTFQEEDTIVERVLGVQTSTFDPLVLFEYLERTVTSHSLTAQPCPHRGSQNLTIVLDGVLQHSDSTGHSYKVVGKSVQYLLTGRGILVSEWGEWTGIELWFSTVNKRTSPPASAFFDFASLPGYTSLSTDLRIIAGTYQDHSSPLQLTCQGIVLYFTLKPLCHQKIVLNRGWNFLIYVIKGKIQIDKTFSINEKEYMFQEKVDREFVDVKAIQQSQYVLVCCDKGDGVYAFGPFVGANREEAERAAWEYKCAKNGFEKKNWQPNSTLKL